jgi:5-methylcytosine-specific restriction endonuclease McrA
MKRFYDSVRWRKLRKWFLSINPLCVICLKMGRETPATIVDHKKPHKGNYELFWDQDNWQSLCAGCHSAVKQQQERSGYSQACGVDGMPIDDNHPFNKVKS